MAKGRKRKAGKRDVVDIIGPTDQQMAHYDYERATLAYRRVPVIVTLADQGKISDRQFNGLSRYRDIGIKCERSEIMDSCQRLLHVPGGDGDGPSLSTMRAYQELGWLEREMGALVNIARAICIEDMTLSQWAIRQGGSVMRERDGPARKIIRWFEPRRAAHKMALMDIRMAGERLAAAIGA